MGTFEKLGILVIVVIIVMILAVAIYQWGGTGSPATVTSGEGAGELTIVELEDLEEENRRAAEESPSPSPAPDAWPGGIPKVYRVERDDTLWDLVVKKWSLRETFIKEVEKANPKVNFSRLKPGQQLAIPDPSAHVRSKSAPAPLPPAPSGTRTYEIKAGDTLESIARYQLTRPERWPEIQKLNPELNPKNLPEGKTIFLPVN